MIGNLALRLVPNQEQVKNAAMNAVRGNQE
jgi:hypothetical protein